MGRRVLLAEGERDLHAQHHMVVVFAHLGYFMSKHRLVVDDVEASAEDVADRFAAVSTSVRVLLAILMGGVLEAIHEEPILDACARVRAALH